MRKTLRTIVIILAFTLVMSYTPLFMESSGQVGCEKAYASTGYGDEYPFYPENPTSYTAAVTGHSRSDLGTLTNNSSVLFYPGDTLTFQIDSGVISGVRYMGYTSYRDLETEMGLETECVQRQDINGRTKYFYTSIKVPDTAQQALVITWGSQGGARLVDDPGTDDDESKWASVDFTDGWAPLYIDITYELDGGTILSGANPTKILNPKQFTYLKFSTRPYKEGAWLSGMTREYGTNVYPCKDFPCGATSFSPIYEEGTSASETVNAGWSTGDWHTSTFTYMTNGGTIDGVQNPIIEFDAASTPDEYAPAVRSNIDLSVVPVKSGSVFEGWYSDEELTQPISSSSVLPYRTSTNIYRTYAKWKDGPQDISKTAKAVLSKTSYVYTGSAFKPGVTVTLGDKTLVKDTDYKVTYSSNKNVGTAKVSVQGIGKYTGTITLNFKITPKAISKAKITLSYTVYTYNGKARKPSVTVKDGSKVLTKDTDYTLSYASGRKDVGSYKITIKGKGNYSGSTTETFKINPKGTTLDSITAGKKTLTVKWIKQAGKMSSARITGYKIQIATDSKFTKNAKTYTVAGYTKVSKKITGLKAKTTYYVRVKTYKTISGTTYVSKWSAYKKKKTQ